MDEQKLNKEKIYDTFLFSIFSVLLLIPPGLFFYLESPRKGKMVFLWNVIMPFIMNLILASIFQVVFEDNIRNSKSKIFCILSLSLIIFCTVLIGFSFKDNVFLAYALVHALVFSAISGATYIVMLIFYYNGSIAEK